ncbi:FGGY-family carbohydrate kinase [Streptomyces luomodiensis]|uniref:FGGY-family carbohydrate kinase n=1 Tax=Streptomyces luomodiensis TaxID=3026192 RepID=A0ABY9V8F1_9ACTN|nr:FGGY-family carbohydrate kinase [Streptomyces sp. SCA4-21]WNF01197.1 FGGY-family carbohydrate kinase [Streptomyces sp. SCA4-21]
MSAHVIAVDVGTSAVRAALVDSAGHIVSQQRISRVSGLGGDTFDAAALDKDVRAALSGVSGGPAPAALAVAAHIGTVAVDSALMPVGRSSGWADSVGVSQLTALGDGAVRRLLHTAGRPTLTGGALAYLLGMDPKSMPRVHAVLSPKDFLVARLTGRLTSDTISAAYTLASDVRRRAWNLDVLRAADLDSALLPEQAEPTSVVGALTEEAATATGLPAGLPVVAGGPDGSVGMGLLLGTDEDIIADVAGTTDVVGRLLPRGEDVPDGAVLNPSVLPGRFVAGGATGLTGGAVAQWRSLVGTVDDERLAALPPGAHGLVILPGMTGARFPDWRPGARGAVLGQRPEHDAACILRAAQEAASFTVRDGLDRLDPSGRLPVAFAGGSSRSAHVAQLRADILARPLLVSPQPDVTLLGAAALAFLGCGAATSLDALRSRLIGTLRRVEPDDARAARYARLHTRWRNLRDATDAAYAEGFANYG